MTIIGVGKMNIQAILIKLVIAVVFVVNIFIFGFLIADAKCVPQKRMLCEKKGEAQVAPKVQLSPAFQPYTFELKASQQIMAVLHLIGRTF